MKSTNEKALKILDKAIFLALACDHGKQRPGMVIQAMSPEDRAILQELTSDDTGNQRPTFL
jgi:hypothetical protein